MLVTSRNIISSDATIQELLATIQDDLVAKQTYAVGQQFIYAGVLYKVTKSGGILTGATINLATDVETSDTVTDQLLGVANQNQYATATGTTHVQLWTLINSLNNRQKDNLVLTVNSPNRGGGVLRRTLQSQYEGYSCGQSAISVMLLTTTGYYYRLYKFDGTAPATNAETISSWSASWVI